MFSYLLRQDRERAGLTIEQAALRFGVRPVAYRKLEAGGRWPDWTTYDLGATAFGWTTRLDLTGYVGGLTFGSRASEHACIHRASD
jgi:transcriptional regulator with XRE-family HTH domain